MIQKAAFIFEGRFFIALLAEAVVFILPSPFSKVLLSFQSNTVVSVIFNICGFEIQFNRYTANTPPQ